MLGAADPTQPHSYGTDALFQAVRASLVLSFALSPFWAFLTANSEPEGLNKRL